LVVLITDGNLILRILCVNILSFQVLLLSIKRKTLKYLNGVLCQMKVNNKEYRQGAAAYRKGKHLIRDNPYKHGSRKWQSWINGHGDADDKELMENAMRYRLFV
jgi:hypothetical protein